VGTVLNIYENEVAISIFKILQKYMQIYENEVAISIFKILQKYMQNLNFEVKINVGGLWKSVC